MTINTEIRTLASSELDRVAGGTPFLVGLMVGSTIQVVIGAAAHYGVFDSVAVKDGVVYVGGVPQN